MSATSSAAASESTLTFDANVAAVVKVLMATKALDGKSLAPKVGMTKSTMYLRLNGKPWVAGELDRIAAFFDVSPRVFFAPVDALGQNWKNLNRPDLRVYEGGGETDRRVGALRLV